MAIRKSLIMKIGKFKMHLDPLKRGISSSLWGQGYREPCFMWIIKDEAKGKLGIDIGANLGYVTLHMCNNLDKVIAIEPDKSVRKLLKRNIKENNFQKKVKIYNFAVSDKDGEETIYLFRKHPNLNTLCNTKDMKKSLKKDYLGKKKVETKKIDSLGLFPDFMKMDLEGYEVEAIRGSMKTLKSVKHCKLLIEVHPQFYNKDRDFSKIMINLFNMGFYAKYIVSAGSECPNLFKQKGYKPFKVFKDEERKRGIFKDISQDDAISFCAFQHEHKEPNGKIGKKVARAILLVK